MNVTVSHKRARLLQELANFTKYVYWAGETLSRQQRLVLLSLMFLHTSFANVREPLYNTQGS